MYKLPVAIQTAEAMDAQALARHDGSRRSMLQESTSMETRGLTLTPIGTLHTPWRAVTDCPRNGRQPDPAPVCIAHVLPAFQDGLRSLEGFSHLILLYWLDQAKPAEMVFTPPFDPTPRGVFATRAPWRPNPIAVSVVAFEGFQAPGVLAVRYLDCVDGTALLDIKPYLPTTDSEPAATMGWLDPHATRRKG